MNPFKDETFFYQTLALYCGDRLLFKDIELSKASLPNALELSRALASLEQLL